MEEKNLTLAEEYNQRGKVLYSVDKYSEAIEMYKKAEQEDPMVKETYYNLAESYVMLDDYEKAKSSLNKVILIDKKDGLAYFHLGNIEFLLDNKKSGMEYYAKAVNNGYDDAHVYFNLGVVSEEENDFESALKYYNKAILKDKFMAEAKLKKADIYMDAQKFDEAIQTLDDLLEYNPDVFEGYHYKFIIYINQNNLVKAEETVNKGLAMFPDDEGFIFDKILLLERKGQYDEAMALVDCELSKGESEALLSEKGKILLATEKTDDAAEVFSNICVKYQDSVNPEVYFYLMNIYSSKNEYEKALEYVEKIIALNEDNQYYYSAIYFKPLILSNMNKPEAKSEFLKAADTLRFASSANPGNLDLIIYRALCFKELKDYDKALELVNYLLMVNSEIGEAYLIRSEIYRDLNELEKAESDRITAMSKSRLLLSVLQSNN